MKAYCAIFFIAMFCSCRMPFIQNMTERGTKTEDDLKSELSAAGIFPAFPVSGFIQFKHAGENVPGVSQADILAYGDSHGVFVIDAPVELSKDKLTHWALEYNRMSLGKLRALDEAQDL